MWQKQWLKSHNYEAFFPMMDRHGREALWWTQPIRQALHGLARPFRHWTYRESGRFEWSEGKDFLLRGGQAPGSVEDRRTKYDLCQVVMLQVWKAEETETG